MPIIEPEFMELTANLDLEAFWAENAQCFNFTTDKPRCPASFAPDDHWIFEFMNVESTVRYYHDKAYRDGLHKQVNEATQKYVGCTWFDEDTFEHLPKRIENLFGCEFTYHEHSTPWLTPVTDDPDEFALVLDQAEATNVAAWALPDAVSQRMGTACRTGTHAAQVGRRQPRPCHHHDIGAESGDLLLLDSGSSRFAGALPGYSGAKDGRVQPGAARFQR